MNTNTKEILESLTEVLFIIGVFVAAIWGCVG